MGQKSTPGILYVTMQPKEGLADAHFHDWYQNEHGPNRLRLSFCNNGFRYRAFDLEDRTGSKDTPEWMAIYDFDELEWLNKEVYLRLRSAPVQSQRERDTMKQIFIDRRSYDLIREWKASTFVDLQKVENEGEKNVMIAVSFILHPGQDNEDELQKWYEDEHVSMLQSVTGWRRTRRFVTSHLDLESGHKTQKEYVALHEFSLQNGLAGPEFKAAISTDWYKRIFANVVQQSTIRRYHLCYTFGPASRDLKSIASSNNQPNFFTENKTTTRYEDGKDPKIESFITTPDGVELTYLLEGSHDPAAPLLVLINSILVDYQIWSKFVEEFQRLTNNKYRILRYNARGRDPLPANSTKDITVDTLARDVISMLDALRVKTASIVGVSLGGATALNVAMSYPDRITAFISCDTNAFAPISNAQAWNDRVAMCEKLGAKSQSGRAIVGEDLAEVTVRRWFVKESYDNKHTKQSIQQVKDMVRTNSLPGFRDSVKALHQYDMRDKMASFKGKGAFLVGAGDGVLPKTMKENMADKLGSGTVLKIIEGAGHLPMVEQPSEVAQFVTDFLEGRGP